MHAQTHHTHTAGPPQMMTLVCFCLLSCTHINSHAHTLTHTYTHTDSYYTKPAGPLQPILLLVSARYHAHMHTFSLSHTHIHTHWLTPYKPINTASPQPVLQLVSARFFHHDNTQTCTHTDSPSLTHTYTQTLPLSHTHTHRLSLSHTHTDSCHTNPASSQPALLVSAHFFYHAHTHIHPCHTNLASLPQLTLWPVWVAKQHWRQCLGLCPAAWSASCVGRATATGPVWSCGPGQALFQTHHGWRSSAPWAVTNT